MFGECQPIGLAARVILDTFGRAVGVLHTERAALGCCTAGFYALQ
jgi:hypothetical protein